VEMVAYRKISNVGNRNLAKASEFKLRKLGVCCNEKSSGWISERAIIACSYDFSQSSIDSINIQSPVSCHYHVTIFFNSHRRMNIGSMLKIRSRNVLMLT
jgi:hypothetical protein